MELYWRTLLLLALVLPCLGLLRNLKFPTDMRPKLEGQCLKYGSDKAVEEFQEAEKELKMCVVKVFMGSGSSGERQATTLFNQYCKLGRELQGCLDKFSHSVSRCFPAHEQRLLVTVPQAIDQLLETVCVQDREAIIRFAKQEDKDMTECLKPLVKGWESCTQPLLSTENLSRIIAAFTGEDLEEQALSCEGLSEVENCIISTLDSCQEDAPLRITRAFGDMMRVIGGCQDGDLKERQNGGQDMRENGGDDDEEEEEEESNYQYYDADDEFREFHEEL